MMIAMWVGAAAFWVTVWRDRAPRRRRQLHPLSVLHAAVR
jgi:hypothetical protein